MFLLRLSQGIRLYEVKYVHFTLKILKRYSTSHRWVESVQGMCPTPMNAKNRTRKQSLEFAVLFRNLVPLYQFELFPAKYVHRWKQSPKHLAGIAQIGESYYCICCHYYSHSSYRPSADDDRTRTLSTDCIPQKYLNACTHAWMRAHTHTQRQTRTDGWMDG